jgi:hypothetical protein
MSLLNELKAQVKKVGSSKSKIVYYKPNSKVRLRFLHDLEDGMKIPFHDSFEKGINVPCQTLFGRECPYCNDDSLRHRNLFAWSVWDYEANEVKITMHAVSNASPLPALVAMYETYGTLTDRDYVIARNGQGPTTTYSVVPMDKSKFNNKAKPFSTEKMLEIIDKAFPTPDVEITVNAKTKEVKKDVDDEDDNNDEYENMTAKQLYQLCLEKGIKVKPKQDKDYYIEVLKEYESENESEEDVDEDEEW